MGLNVTSVHGFFEYYNHFKWNINCVEKELCSSTCSSPIKTMCVDVHWFRWFSFDVTTSSPFPHQFFLIEMLFLKNIYEVNVINETLVNVMFAQIIRKLLENY